MSYYCSNVQFSYAFYGQCNGTLEIIIMNSENSITCKEKADKMFRKIRNYLCRHNFPRHQIQKNI